ncbi:M55 family metallopeptidase [Bryobacter aggregatus]|uniref:M55 family metallopeptidase n=1 Tax=Bryobacter aggregatus TaxID=360054 RepID=UPI0006912C6B|nr:M55 family metallopeptidase [Bryobacter aggregatus]
MLLNSRWIPVLALSAFGLFSETAIAQKRVFVITDAEGVAGVCHQDQTDPKGTDMPALLTGEINAAVEGFLAGGATEVIVWDGHSMAHNLSALTIHPKARLIMGALPAAMTLERKYAAIAFVGQHAMGNVPDAIMAHSFSSLGIQTMKVNGKPVGEIDVRAAMAGHFGTPVIFLSGDHAAADELKAIVPKAVTAVVKQGLLRNSCETMSAVAARELIQAKAKESMSQLTSIAPYTVKGPVTLEIEYTTRNSLNPDAKYWPNAKVLGDRTVQFFGKDIIEAWTNSRIFR